LHIDPDRYNKYFSILFLSFCRDSLKKYNPAKDMRTFYYSKICGLPTFIFTQILFSVLVRAQKC
jgi:hypothetical protein